MQLLLLIGLNSKGIIQAKLNLSFNLITALFSLGHLNFLIIQRQLNSLKMDEASWNKYYISQVSDLLYKNGKW